MPAIASGFIARVASTAWFRAMQVEELARKLQSEEAERILLVDVRSHGYYDRGAARIRGSIRIEPNNLTEELKTLPKDKDIYLYCT